MQSLTFQGGGSIKGVCVLFLSALGSSSWCDMSCLQAEQGRTGPAPCVAPRPRAACLCAGVCTWGLGRAACPATCSWGTAQKGLGLLFSLCVESFRRVCGAEESWTREELPTGTNEPFTQAQLLSVRL